MFPVSWFAPVIYRRIYRQRGRLKRRKYLNHAHETRPAAMNLRMTLDGWMARNICCSIVVTLENHVLGYSSINKRFQCFKCLQLYESTLG